MMPASSDSRPGRDEETAGQGPAEIELVGSLSPARLGELASAGREALGEAALDKWFLPVVARWGLLLVARLDGALAGSAQAVRCLEPGDIYMDIFYVLPQYRRRGIGRALLARMMTEASRQHCRRLLVTVEPGNEAAAALYRSAGFLPEKELIDFYGAGHDRVVMAAPLGGNP